MNFLHTLLRQSISFNKYSISFSMWHEFFNILKLYNIVITHSRCSAIKKIISVKPPYIENRTSPLCKLESLCTALDSPDYSGLSAFISSPSFTIRIVATVFYYSRFIFVCRALARASRCITLRTLFIVISRYIVRVTRFLLCSMYSAFYLFSPYIHLHVSNSIFAREDFLKIAQLLSNNKVN